MKGLRALKLTMCENSHFLIHTLDPSTDSPEVVVCPELEDIVIVFSTAREIFDIKGVIGMVAARASRGAKLTSIRIVSDRKFARADVSELKNTPCTWNVILRWMESAAMTLMEPAVTAIVVMRLKKLVVKVIVVMRKIE